MLPKVLLGRLSPETWFLLAATPAWHRKLNPSVIESRNVKKNMRPPRRLLHTLASSLSIAEQVWTIWRMMGRITLMWPRESCHDTYDNFKLVRRVIALTSLACNIWFIRFSKRRSMTSRIWNPNWALLCLPPSTACASCSAYSSSSDHSSCAGIRSQYLPRSLITLFYNKTMFCCFVFILGELIRQ